MLHEIKETIFNKLIVWLMNHTHCWSTVFYTACKRYYPGSVVAMYKSWYEANKDKIEG
jgi:hypothetical protein